MRLPDLKIKKLAMLTGDLAILYVSLLAALFIRYGINLDQKQFLSHLAPFTIIYLIWLIIFYAFGLYDFETMKSGFIFFQTALPAFLVNVIVAVLFFYFFPFPGITPKTNLLINISIFAIIFYFWRNLFKKILKITPLQKVFIIGEGKESEEISKFIKENPHLGYELAGFEKNQEKFQDIMGQREGQIIITDFNLEKHASIAKNFISYIESGIRLVNLPIFYEHIFQKTPVSLINHVWFLENLTKKNSYESLKRALDLLLALPAGILFLTVFPFIALGIKLSDKGPIFFKQKRVGQKGKIYEIWKFRTMIEKAEANGAVWAENNDPRVTTVGKILRKTRLDELPQIINVIKGQMSFVGPRPERPEFVENLKTQIPFYDIRHLIRPGLTGWAQINFPYGASVQDALQKLQYEIYYIKHRSLVMDLAIILKTIKTLIGARGR